MIKLRHENRSDSPLVEKHRDFSINENQVNISSSAATSAILSMYSISYDGINNDNNNNNSSVTRQVCLIGSNLGYLNIKTNLSLSIYYHNYTLSCWEPMIEPLHTQLEVSAFIGDLIGLPANAITACNMFEGFIYTPSPPQPLLYIYIHSLFLSFYII